LGVQIYKIFYFANPLEEIIPPADEERADRTAPLRCCSHNAEGIES